MEPMIRRMMLVRRLHLLEVMIRDRIQENLIAESIESKRSQLEENSASPRM